MITSPVLTVNGALFMNADTAFISRGVAENWPGVTPEVANELTELAKQQKTAGWKTVRIDKPITNAYISALPVSTDEFATWATNINLEALQIILKEH
jgi:hypothetical protein